MPFKQSSGLVLHNNLSVSSDYQATSRLGLLHWSHVTLSVILHSLTVSTMDSTPEPPLTLNNNTRGVLSTPSTHTPNGFMRIRFCPKLILQCSSIGVNPIITQIKMLECLPKSFVHFTHQSAKESMKSPASQVY